MTKLIRTCILHVDIHLYVQLFLSRKICTYNCFFPGKMPPPDFWVFFSLHSGLNTSVVLFFDVEQARKCQAHSLVDWALAPYEPVVE